MVVGSVVPVLATFGAETAAHEPRKANDASIVQRRKCLSGSKT